MLRSFRLTNHRSFATEQELSLLPVYDRAQPALPVAAIYGANASGKSNLLDGLAFMRSAVLDSFRSWDADGGVHAGRSASTQPCAPSPRATSSMW